MNNIINRNRIILENNDMSVLITSLIFFLCFCNIPPHINNFIKYLVDIVALVLLFALFYNKSIYKYFFNPLFLVQIIMLFIGIVIALVNLCKPLQIFWCVRNYLKPLIVYIACIEFLKINDIKQIMRFFNVIYYINFLLILFEFFVLGARDDYLGGICGVGPGNTTINNLILTFMVSYFLVLFVFKKQSIFKTIFIVLSSIFMATLMELKYFYFELLLMIITTSILYCVYNGKGASVIASITIIFCALIGLYFGLLLLIQIYPKWKDLFDLSNWIYEITRESGYNGTGEINRLYFVDTINNLFHDNNIINMAFGEGFGASQVSYSSALASKDTNLIRLLMINSFSIPMIYLDCGYVGIALYVFSFIITGIQGIRYLFLYRQVNNECIKKSLEIDLISIENCAMMTVFSITIIVLAIPMLIYNSSMICPEACIYYFGIACMYIAVKNIETRKQIYD